MTFTTSVPLRHRTWYVRPRRGRWVVQRQDAERAASLHDTKEDAIARATEYGRKVHGRVRVKGLDGRLEQEQLFVDG